VYRNIGDLLRMVLTLFEGIRSTVYELHVAGLQTFSNIMVLYIDMFCACVEGGVFCKGNCAFVVAIYGGWRELFEPN
jgi:hypothetical protein